MYTYVSACVRECVVQKPRVYKRDLGRTLGFGCASADQESGRPSKKKTSQRWLKKGIFQRNRDPGRFRGVWGTIILSQSESFESCRKATGRSLTGLAGNVWLG